MLWEHLLKSREAQDAYNRSALFRNMVNIVKREELAKQLDPIEFLGHTIAVIALAREEWMLAIKDVLAHMTRPAGHVQPPNMVSHVRPPAAPPYWYEG
jgi:hypothetical protein